MTEKELKEIGIDQYGVISPAEIEFSDEIRKLCEGNVCRQYARTWACPPAVGTVNECRERCLQFDRAMVFCAVNALEDSFDYEGMTAGHMAFKELCDRLYALMKRYTSKFLLLSNEGCARCEVCTYPDAPCRMPRMLFPSLEGYSIQVMRLSKMARVAYNNGKNTVTYFGMVLYKAAEEEP